MLDVLLDTLLDVLKLIPFLFFAFIIIELIEHKFSKKTTDVIKKSGKFGPFFGSLLGLLPQCGFSVLATNLYITRILSLGTLVAIYLSTSDEMLPILISERAPFKSIVIILIIKFIVGIIVGFLIDLIYHPNKEEHIHDLCEHDHCHCEEDGILKSSILHTLKTVLFIAIITFILNTVMHYVGEDYLSDLLSKNTFLTPFISSLIGLIPNCGASIVITELYLNNVINLGTTIAGLLTGSGVAILVLFKGNKSLKENLSIMGIIYIVGVVVGLIIELITTII
ncbi:MAG: arsenic efflux protein [Bacilli bacterium]|nr:arsenic efflux protein [Bacilli bacterium]